MCSSDLWDAADGFAAGDLVDDLEAFADELGLDAFHLVGFSMGGMTALAFAARRPERLLSLVVAGIVPDREPRASVARRTMDPERIERDDRAWAAELARLHDPVQGSGAWRRLLPAIAADVATQPLLTARDLHGITAPTLVSCGDRDPYVPVTKAEALAHQIHGGHLLVVPDAGHRILLTHPTIVGAALTSFYRARASVTLRPAEASQEDPR